MGSNPIRVTKIKIMENREELIAHFNKKYPKLDSGKILSIIDKNLTKMEVGVLESNQTLTLPLSCDLNKDLIISVVDELLNGAKEEKTIEPLTDVWSIATSMMRSGKFIDLREFIKSYTTEEADLGQMKMVLVATKSMKTSPEISDDRLALLHLLEKRLGHKLV